MINKDGGREPGGLQGTLPLHTRRGIRKKGNTSQTQALCSRQSAQSSIMPQSLVMLAHSSDTDMGSRSPCHGACWAPRLRIWGRIRWFPAGAGKNVPSRHGAAGEAAAGVRDLGSAWPRSLALGVSGGRAKEGLGWRDQWSVPGAPGDGIGRWRRCGLFSYSDPAQPSQAGSERETGLQRLDMPMRKPRLGRCPRVGCGTQSPAWGPAGHPPATCAELPGSVKKRKGAYSTLDSGWSEG